MKLTSLKTFLSENESSILDLKKAASTYGAYEPADSSQYLEGSSTNPITSGGDTDCVDTWYNDAGGKIMDLIPYQ